MTSIPNNDSRGQRHMVRWKNEQQGPYSRDELSTRLADGTFSLLHRVQVGEKWVGLGAFLETAADDYDPPAETKRQDDVKPLKQPAPPRAHADKVARMSPEATRPPAVVSPPPKDIPSEGEHVNDVLRRKSKNIRLGGAFWTSVLVHAILAVLGLCYTVHRYLAPPTPKPDPTFVASSGGGGGKATSTGAKPISMKVAQRSAQPQAAVTRIAVRSAVSAIALPDAKPVMPSTMAFAMPMGKLQNSAFKGDLGGGGTGGGEGGGIGNGIGTGRGNGIGPGFGNGKRATANFLGGRVSAGRVALYLDKSGSMQPYLDLVTKEAKRAFPKAEIFMIDGCRTTVSAEGAVSTDSVGGWFSSMLAEQYDTLVIFADFQDGVTQAGVFREWRPGPISNERPPAVQTTPTKSTSKGKRTNVITLSGNYDYRTPEQSEWENVWIERCMQAREGKGPRVYCFSTDVRPQSLWLRCVEASGGGAYLIPWIRKNGNGNAKETETLIEPMDGAVSPVKNKHVR